MIASQRLMTAPPAQAGEMETVVAAAENGAGEQDGEKEREKDGGRGNGRRDKGQKTSSLCSKGGSRASSSHEGHLGQQRAKAWVTTSPRREKQFTPEQSTNPGLAYLPACLPACLPTYLPTYLPYLPYARRWLLSNMAPPPSAAPWTDGVHVHTHSIIRT